MRATGCLCLLLLLCGHGDAQDAVIDDHCEHRKNLMFDERDIEKNTERNNEWHALIKQAHRDEVSDEVFADADIAHYVGKSTEEINLKMFMC